MSKPIEEEVQQVLNQTTDQVEFEEALAPQSSPLAQPVVENEIGHTHPEEETEPVEPLAAQQEDLEQEETPSSEEALNFQPNEPDHVPEQEIGSGTYQEQLEEELATDEGDSFELPSSHAKQAADTILGMTDNVLAVGGGFFIKIKKHKEFYDFEEVVQVIDEQNEKNIRRLKLDDEDKILLRPLLISMLKRKAKKLSPEQQLLGAVLSILMKKAQVVLEIKAENDILVDRILDVIREEKGYSDQDLEEEETEPMVESTNSVSAQEEATPDKPEVQEVETDQEEFDELSHTVMEVVPEEDAEKS